MGSSLECELNLYKHLERPCTRGTARLALSVIIIASSMRKRKITKQGGRNWTQTEMEEDAARTSITKDDFWSSSRAELTRRLVMWDGWPSSTARPLTGSHSAPLQTQRSCSERRKLKQNLAQNEKIPHALKSTSWTLRSESTFGPHARSVAFAFASVFPSRQLFFTESNTNRWRTIWEHWLW